MPRALPFLAAIVIAALVPPSARACTIFKITLNGRTYLGNNEAWTDGDTKAWFLVAEPGKYGRVFFGYKNGYAQGGMNERGLAYDWVAGYNADWKRDDAKPDFAGNFGEMVLERAATVEEAIAIFERFNEPELAGARTLLADKSGASAIISWQDGKLHVARDAGKCQALGWEEAATLKRLHDLEQSPSAATSRPSAAEETAADGTAAGAADAVIDAVGAVLSACQQTGKYTTFYSNVYDLSAGEIHLYQFYSKVPVARLDLKRELAKGNHFYDLPRIAEQLTLPPATDGRTQTRVAVDPACYAALAGRYAIAGQGWLDILNRDGRLFVQFPGDKAYELCPASPTKFFLPFIDVQLTFTLDAAGWAKEVAVHTWEKDLTASRATPTTSEHTASAPATPAPATSEPATSAPATSEPPTSQP